MEAGGCCCAKSTGQFASVHLPNYSSDSQRLSCSYNQCAAGWRLWMSSIDMAAI